MNKPHKDTPMTRRPLTKEEKEDALRLRKLWKERKDDLHLSQIKAAKEMGFSSQSAVSQYLNAKLPLNMAAVARFSQILHVKAEEISPRFAKDMGEPIPMPLSSYTPPEVGDISGVATGKTVNWFAFSKEFTELVGTTHLKLFLLDEPAAKFPQGSVLVVDDSESKISQDGSYLIASDGNIVLAEVTTEDGGVIVSSANKTITLPLDALPLMRVLARVLAIVTKP